MCTWSRSTFARTYINSKISFTVTACPHIMVIIVVVIHFLFTGPGGDSRATLHSAQRFGVSCFSPEPVYRKFKDAAVENACSEKIFDASVRNSWEF